MLKGSDNPRPMITLAAPPCRARALTPRVEILGAFGSGKTTLAQQLAIHAQFRLLPEDHSKNPFWGHSRAIEATGYLPYDLSFLIDHVHLATALQPEPAGTVGICDWSFATDRLWASMRLGVDLPAYDNVHSILLDRVGPPIGYLYLRQPAHVVVERVRLRGRGQEAAFAEYVTAATASVEELAMTLPLPQVQIVGDDDISLALDRIRNWLRESVG